MTIIDKVLVAVKALDEKKGNKISAVKITELSSVADYLVFAEATSTTHVRALADIVEEKLSESGVEPHHIEGRTTGWYLLDYTDFVVHVFTPQQNEFYNLSKLWADGEEVDISSALTE